MGGRMTEDKFNRIKHLINTGYSKKEIMKNEIISSVTYSRVKNRADYGAYSTWVKEHSGSKHSPERKKFYNDYSDREKIVMHYNSILDHMIEIGRILNGFGNEGGQTQWKKKA